MFESFPPEGLKIKWRVPAAYGFSSPVVARGRVCLTDAQLKSPNVEARVRCFDESTGALLWQKDLAKGHQIDEMTAHSSSPFV